MTDAVFKATYANFKNVQGRKVLQIILEVPIEKAHEVLDVLGMPTAGDTWVAVAKLQEPTIDNEIAIS